MTSNGVISMYALTMRGASAPMSRPCQGCGRQREKLCSVMESHANGDIPDFLAKGDSPAPKSPPMPIPMARGAAITGWGKCLPPAVLTNPDIATFLDTSDEWITTRTGIRERRVSHVPLGELMYVSAARALACAGLDGRDVELI